MLYRMYCKTIVFMIEARILCHHDGENYRFVSFYFQINHVNSETIFNRENDVKSLQQ